MKKLLAAAALSCLLLAACDNADSSKTSAKVENATAEANAAINAAVDKATEENNVEGQKQQNSSEIAQDEKSQADGDKKEMDNSTTEVTAQADDSDVKNTNKKIRHHRKTLSEYSAEELRIASAEERRVEGEKPVLNYQSEIEFAKQQCRYNFASQAEAKKYGCGVQASVLR